MSALPTLFGRALLVGAAALPLLLASCVDAPSAPERGDGALVIAPVLSLLGPDGPARNEAQEGALAAAFGLVDRFRLEVRRVSDNALVLETVVTVTPGQEEYDLTVPISAPPGERFLVTLTALQGETVLFTATAIPATAAAAPPPGAPGPTPVQIPLVYSGPGATATSVTVSPAQVVLAPGGGASLTATVLGDGGAPVAGVPLFWTATGAATVSGAGAVTMAAEGVGVVTVSTPSGQQATATFYGVTGEIAYVEGGALKVRDAVGGAASTRGEGAEQPAWSPDGAQLYYVSGGVVQRAGGGPLADGAWPGVSPDGAKLAVERGGTVWFLNDDGTGATQGPSGQAPVWADGARLLVGGGGIHRVRADGADRTTLVPAGASLPALAGDGRLAWIDAGSLHATDAPGALVSGAIGRPSWSPDGRWLVVATGASGLVLVPSDGSAPPVALPGLTGAGDPAWRPRGGLAAVPDVRVDGFEPDPPVPGSAVSILGTGFDWIIPGNTHVFWPTRGGTVSSPVSAVTQNAIATVMPRDVIAGQVRVETRASQAALAFEPRFGSLEVTARAPWGAGVGGVGVALAGPAGSLSGTTGADGVLRFDGLLPGSWTATLTPPEGWTLEGDAVRGLTIGTETLALELTLTPGIASVALSPAAPALEVGGSLDVTLVVTGADGRPVPQVEGLSWRSASPELGVTPGAGLTASLGATFAGEGPGSSTLEVTVAGRAYTFPVTVTSTISGTVTRAEGDAALPDVAVRIERGGAPVAEPRTGADGRFVASGLFRGTYDVAPAPLEDLLPIPEGQTVILDQANPTGRADFRMQSFAGLSVRARTPWDAPVAGVALSLRNGEGAVVASGTVDAAGNLTLARIAPGTYTLVATAPSGFTLTEVPTEPLTLAPGSQAVSLVLTPAVAAIRSIPADLAVEVGGTLDVEVVALDITGAVIPTVRSASWFSSTLGLAASGSLFKGTIGGVFPSPSGAPFALRVELDGRIFEFPVAVTSYIGGLISTADAPAGVEAPEGVDAPAASPAPGVTVFLKRDGSVVAEGRTDGEGRYRIGGLAAGTYEVAPGPFGELTPVPVYRTVALDAANPTGTADFQMAGGSLSSLVLSADPTVLEALAATTLVSVQYLDADEAPIAPRPTTWTSSNDAVATVDANGLVTAVTNGTVTITATADDVVGTIQIQVDQKAAMIEITNLETGLPLGPVQGFAEDTGTLGYQAKDANGHPVPEAHRTPTFASSDIEVVTVTPQGLVTLVGPGSASVTATMDGVSDAVTFTVLESFPEDLIIETEADLLAVQDALIGRVAGNLIISGTSLTNVDGLESILAVDGSVSIMGNAALVDLDGLANLRELGGSLELVDNPLLAGNGFFPALTEIPGDLLVARGARILGMPGLEKVGGTLLLQEFGDEDLLLGGPQGVVVPDHVLEEARFPGLLEVGAMQVQENALLTTLEFPSLATVLGVVQDGGGAGLVRASDEGRPEMVRQLSDRMAAVETVVNRRASILERAERARAASRAGHVGSERDEARNLQASLRASARPERVAAPPRSLSAPRGLTEGPQLEGGYTIGAMISGSPVLATLNLSALTEVTGGLTLSYLHGLDALVLGSLERVEGSLYVHAIDAPIPFAAPSLESVSAYLSVSYTDFTAVELPALATVGLSVEFYGNTGLAEVEVATAGPFGVGDYFVFISNHGVTTLQMPGLESLGGDLVFDGNTINGSVVVGSSGPLHVGGSLVYTGIEGSHTASFPGLASVGEHLFVTHNSGLTAFTAASTGGPATVTFDVFLLNNSALTSASFPMITSLVGLDVLENPVLANFSMPALTAATEYLNIAENTALASLGFPVLAGHVPFVGVYDNPGLQGSLSFPAITSSEDIFLDGNGTPGTPVTVAFPVLGDVEWWVNLLGYEPSGLTSFSAPQLATAGGLFIGGFTTLTTVDLPSLTTVVYDLQIYDNVDFPSFTLPDLSRAGLFEVYDNVGLTSFSLPSLQRLEWDFEVGYNVGLTSFSAPLLSEVREIIEVVAPPAGVPTPINGGDVDISDNPDLTTFDLSALAVARELWIEGNDAMVSLPPLPALGDGIQVEIYENLALADLDGLAGLERPYRLRVIGNPALTDASGVADLVEAWEIGFVGNPLLPSAGLASLTQVWSLLEFRGNDVLASVTAPLLTTVGAGTGPHPSQGVLKLTNAPLLTTATFGSLATLDAGMEIAHVGLVDLNGLSALTSPVFFVDVRENLALTSVAGLSGIGTTSATPAVASLFRIIDHPQLCTEDVAALIATIQARGVGAFGSTPQNTGNKTCTALQQQEED